MVRLSQDAHYTFTIHWYRGGMIVPFVIWEIVCPEHLAKWEVVPDTLVRYTQTSM
jgi:hypothetical protein